MHVAVPRFLVSLRAVSASPSDRCSSLPSQWLQHNLHRGDENIQARVDADHVVSESLNLHFNPRCSSRPNLIPQISLFFYPFPFFLSPFLRLSGRCCRRCTAAVSGPSRRLWSRAAAWSGPDITSSTLSRTAPASTSGRPWTSWSRFARTAKDTGGSSARAQTHSRCCVQLCVACVDMTSREGSNCTEALTLFLLN